MHTRREWLGGAVVTLAASPVLALPPAGFVVAVEDVFTLSGVGVIVAGRVERGVLRPGDAIEVVGLGPSVRTSARHIERFRQRQTEATAGQDVGIALTGVTREQIKRGQVLSTPGLIKPAVRFEAEIAMAASTAGGRRSPAVEGYRPLVRIRTADVSGTVALGRGVTALTPGASSRVTVTLEQPLALETGLRFAFMEGGRAVGSGTISRVTSLS